MAASAGQTFARSAANNGQPMTSVRDIQFDANGSLVSGVFDGVDIRSEGLVDNFVSDFKQANFNLKRRLTDRLEVTMLVGKNRSVWDGRKRLQTFMDVIDADGASIDFRGGGSTPTPGFGFDVSNPANFTYAPGLADGTVPGGFSYQGKPAKNTTDNFTGEVNLAWKLADAFTLKAGGQYRESDFPSTFLRPFNADATVRALPAGTSLASITRQITGVGSLWGNGAPGSWAAIDPDKWASTFGFDQVCYCGVSCGGGRSRVSEEVKSAYAMAAFDLKDAIAFSIRDTANWRDRFIRGIPASPGSDLQGNAPTLYADASASYDVTDNIKLIVEATNLTDEQNTLYIDSKRRDTLFETRIGRTVTAGVNVRF